MWLGAMAVGETESDQLNRIYAALGHINQAIVRTSTRDELFARVCAVLVEHGGFGRASIEWRDPETGRFVLVASAGRAHTEATSDHSPAAIAFRTNAPYVCDVVLDAAATQPWLPSLDSTAVHAAAVFPIHAGGETRGVISVYADRAGAFPPKAIALVTEVAADVSFALDNLAHEAARQIAEARAESERRFADGLLEALPGIVYFYDEAGRFVRWNKNFETVTGYSSDEIWTMHPLDFFNEPEKTAVRDRIGEVFVAGEAHIEASIVAKDGRATPFYLTGKRVSLGGAPHLVGVGVEIGERLAVERALKQSEERYRTTLDAMPDGGQLIGFDWRYLYLNATAERHNRRPNARLLGRRMQDAWPGIEATPMFALFRRAMEERVSTQAETKFVFPDGVTGWYDVRVHPVPEGIFALSSDISQRKRIEEEVRALNETLERKVIERTIDLEAAKVRAEAADKLKSAFLATMSHELRTPLNSILGFTGIVLAKMSGPLTPVQEQQLEIVETSSRHLLALINDVLDISKIEAGQLELDWVPVDLRSIVEQVTSSVAPHVLKKGLHLHIELPAVLPAMQSDPLRVQQILLNIVNNAIKFTRRGDVTVAVESVENDRNGRAAVCLRVTDTGIGIKEEDLSKLFMPFRQLDSGLQRHHEGTGLGLAICDRLVGLLGGYITVESVWDEGSTFAVYLPLRPA